MKSLHPHVNSTRLKNGYFSNICINPYNETKSFLCDYPERVYISERVIKTCPRVLVKQGVFSIVSMFEVVTSNSIENILFDRHLDLSNISKIINKLKNELYDIMSGDLDVKLKLMDMLI